MSLPDYDIVKRLPQGECASHAGAGNVWSLFELTISRGRRANEGLRLFLKVNSLEGCIVTVAEAMVSNHFNRRFSIARSRSRLTSYDLMLP